MERLLNKFLKGAVFMKDNYEYYNMFDITELEKARKKKERQEKAKLRKQKVKETVSKGLTTLIVVGVPTVAAVTPAIVAITGAVKSVNRRAIVKTEKESKENYCYDRSLGHYWELERKLSNSDWLEINKRRDCGEKLADILADMKVLKK